MDCQFDELMTTEKEFAKIFVNLVHKAGMTAACCSDERVLDSYLEQAVVFLSNQLEQTETRKNSKESTIQGEMFNRIHEYGRGFCNEIGKPFTRKMWHEMSQRCQQYMTRCYKR